MDSPEGIATEPTPPTSGSGHDTGGGEPSDPVTVESRWLTSGTIDDGFGSAIVAGEDALWIGAPHGENAVVYRWADETLTVALTGEARLGSHLAWTEDGLWIAAPLVNSGEGAVLRLDGTRHTDGFGGTGITLTSTGGGAYGWEGGWVAHDERTGASPSRPTALHQNHRGTMGVGMAHGPISLLAGDRTVPRTTPGDEAGFSLASAEITGDEIPDWLIGAPGSNTVMALDGSDLSVIKTWTGVGRFGHSVTVCHLGHGDEMTERITIMVIGSPLANGRGKVDLFLNFSETPESSWVGSADTAQLGSTITCLNDGFLAGAPGDAQQAGHVLWVQGLSRRSF